MRTCKGGCGTAVRDKRRYCPACSPTKDPAWRSECARRAARARKWERRPLPFCACRCGQRVLKHGRRWLAGHVPTSLRAFGGKKARSNYAYHRRRVAFDRELKRLTEHGRTITTEAILNAFAAVYREAYQRGYRACEDKWQERRWSRGRKKGVAA